jgi:hypothetical protein
MTGEREGGMRARVVAASLVFAVAYPAFARSVWTGDFLLHINFAFDGLHGKGWPPHPLFHWILLALLGGDNHLPEIGTVVFMMAALLAVRAWITAWALEQANANLAWPFVVLVSLALTVATPLPPWWSADVMNGQMSPNVWHSPTGILAMPLALGLFLLGCRLLERPALKTAAATGLVMLLGVLAKPNYLLAFAPCFGVLLIVSLWRATREQRLGSASAITILLTAIGPAFAVLTVQHATFTTDQRILYAPWEVWRAYTRERIPESIALGLAFPAAALIFFPRQANADQPLLLAWGSTATAIATFACFAESGLRIAHANFAWGITLTNYVLYVASAAFVLRQAHGWRQTICLVLLMLHAASGVAWLATLLV